MSLNKDSSIILALSKWKQNSARVIDLNKGKCIGNWPTSKTKIQLHVFEVKNFQSAFYEYELLKIN